MVTVATLGTIGRLGNQLFMVASATGIAKSIGEDAKFPFWKYSHYFKGKFLSTQRISSPIKVKEIAYHYTPDYWTTEIIRNPGRIVSLEGWLQSEKYWEPYKAEIKELFEFKDDIKANLLTKYAEAFRKPTIAISIRRGDFVDNANYAQLPISYYIGALVKHFPNYKDYNIFCFSDDISYCRHHFECLDNVYYPFAAQDIEQLCLMTMCDNFIISQSTFSWWGAYLGQKPNSIVVRPNYNLDGPLLAANSEKDFWPTTWTKIYDHKKEKIDLLDTTFTIPVHYDHEDRAQNLRAVLAYLRKHFNTKIILGEQGGNHFSITTVDKYIKFNLDKFHRTKMLNDMAEAADTELLANWDVDVIAPVMQIVESVRALREGADMVYPYDGRFARVGRKQWYNKIMHSLDTGIWDKESFPGTRAVDHPSVGGAVFFRKDSFYEGGLENENFISYAPEDQERWYRFNKLGYKVLRTKGNIYHLDHYVGTNSYTLHPLYKDNEKEFHRIRAIPNLRLEVDSWPWYHRYSTKYYSEIIADSNESRDEFFKLPQVIEGVRSIIDVGCGMGSWGKGLQSFIYKGVDYRIPEKYLAIPPQNYKEYNLTSNNAFPFPGKYDLALCMEVLEHIPEEYADNSVKLLTTLSDRVLFSAAIPGQGGINHENEQFQSYWSKIFEKYHFYPINLDIKQNKKIAIWYRQNAVLYVNYKTGQKVVDFIHPEMYCNVVGTHTKWESIKRYEEYE